MGPLRRERPADASKGRTRMLAGSVTCHDRLLRGLGELEVGDFGRAQKAEYQSPLGLGHVAERTQLGDGLTAFILQIGCGGSGRARPADPL